MDAATDNARDFAEADLDFHEAVGHASGNVLMRSLAAVIATALVASFRMSSPVNEAEAHRASVRGHARHVAELEAGDGARAAAATRGSIGHGMRRTETAAGPGQG